MGQNENVKLQVAVGGSRASVLKFLVTVLGQTLRNNNNTLLPNIVCKFTNFL